MDWDKLRIFHAVAKAGSFTHAADALNLSQSAISRQVSSLEQDIGVPLFHRHARGLIPTEQGDLLFNTAQEVMMKLEAVKHQLTDSRERPTGKLRVTTTVGLGSAWLSIRMHEFLDQYPGIEVDLLLYNEELDLSMRQADCAIRLRQPQQPDLIQRRLFTVHFHVFASTSYLEKFGKPESVDDLGDHRLITWGEQAPSYLKEVNWLATAGMPSGTKRPSALKINSILAIKRAVLRGAGIAMLPDYSVEDDTSLVPVMTDIDVPSFDTYFAYSAELKNSVRLNVFRDFLFSKAKSWSY